jgi:CO/xanthine dehydrogenase FAD-binding subunit
MSFPEYIQLKSIEDLNNLPEKKIYFLAGGTDLLNYLRDGLIDCKTSCFVDLSLLKELTFIQEQKSFENQKEIEFIKIGSMVTFNQLANHQLINQFFPVLTSVCKTFATPLISCRATIGGNIANASPSGDSIPALYTLNAKLEIRNKSKIRTQDIDTIFTGPKKTNLQNGDLITSILIPKPKIDNNFKIKGIFKKLGGRKSHIISKLSIAISLIAKDSFIKEINLSLGAVAPTVIKVKKVSEILNNKNLNKELLNQCVEEIQKVISPIDDFRSTATYRRETVNILFLEAMSKLFNTSFL